MKKILVTLMMCSVMLTAYAGDGGDKPTKTPLKIRKRAARPDIPGIFLIEFGLNIPQNLPEALDTRLFGSKAVNLYYFYDIPIGESNFVIMPGIGLGLERFKFDDAVTLSSSKPDVIFPLDTVTSVVLDTLNGEIKKSMLVTNYVDIPLEVRFYANPKDKKRSFYFGLGGRVGFLYSAQTKIKTGDGTKIKLKDTFGLSRFRYGVSGRLGVGGFNVFGYYNLSDMFENGPTGGNGNNLTVGVSFTGF